MRLPAENPKNPCSCFCIATLASKHESALHRCASFVAKITVNSIDHNLCWQDPAARDERGGLPVRPRKGSRFPLFY